MLTMPDFLPVFQLLSSSRVQDWIVGTACSDHEGTILTLTGFDGDVFMVTYLPNFCKFRVTL